MSEIYVTEANEEDLAARARATKMALERQRKRESLQSAITALVGFAVVLALLALVALFPMNEPKIQIISYQAPFEDETPPPKMKEMTNNRQPKPPGASSAMARVIAAEMESPVSVPVPEISVPDNMFGMEEDFGPGFGTGEGSGDGGGGASFFGSRRTGKHVVYCVDFSGSMESDGEAGGTRISALKEELVRSINSLPANMQLSVIYFSTTAWTIDTEGPDPYSKGFRGNGTPPNVPWYPATQQFKQHVISNIEKTPAKGGTNWYPPLKMAFNMTPRPDIVYLLSDGEARDAQEVLVEMDELNPDGVAIDTIAFELPGTPAGELLEISKETGGRFTMIYKGKRLTGGSAEQMTNSKYD